jgi:2-polyprenyl-6-methoxyphenol hydroxylase-like FAD-dependent oxidoreductase
LTEQVGGSIAGLCIGVALKDLPNVNSITILERYKTGQLLDQGAGIRIGDEVAQFLGRYAHVAVDEYSVAMERATMLDTNGDVLVTRHRLNSVGSSWIRLFRVLMRAFMDKRDDQTATCKYLYSRNVRNLTQDGGKIGVRHGSELDGEETLIADMVVGADGASSRVREIFLPEVNRTYVGYVIFRGLVPVEVLSEETRNTMDKTATLCFTRESQVVSYLVPANEDRRPDSENILNWGWYQDKTEDELQELMLDVNGKRNAFTLLPGTMSEAIAQQVREKAQRDLPPRFAEIVAKTEEPFVQVITDSEATQISFLDGKVLLVGDSAAGQRPHGASAVTQACFHAQLLRLRLQGKITAEDWSHEAKSVSSAIVKLGHELGAICMSKSMEQTDKIRLFTAVQGNSFQQLAEKWTEMTAANGWRL